MLYRTERAWLCAVKLLHMPIFLSLVAMLVITVWLFGRIGKAGGTEDALSMPGKCLLTAGILVVFGFSIMNPTPLSVFVLVGCAVPISLLWTPHVIDLIFTPLWSAFDGGGQEVERQPFYHRATGFRKKGLYAEALQEIESQLEQFPGDFDGQMMKAEVLSDHLKDLPGAIGALMEITTDEGRTDRDRILALNRIADLELRRDDRNRAREVLLQILARWPNTEAARFADQRLAHLPSDAVLAAKHETPKVAQREFTQNLGLQMPSGSAERPFESPKEVAARLVRRLGEFPDDSETREELALTYANHFQREDLARMEFETLIAGPNQPVKSVIRWLNLMADIDMKDPKGIEAARKTLQRIVDLYPRSVHAEVAQSRSVRLGLAAKAHVETPKIKIGVYEQNIGLKRSGEI